MMRYPARVLVFLEIGMGVFCGFCFADTNVVRIWEVSGFRYIESNGIPDHQHGVFPNSRNPNRISAQKYTFRVPLKPRLNSRPAEYGHNLFGIALNGIPFDPETAEFWNNDPRSGWNYEALSGKVDLGMDQNQAHVQPNGAYHYHGIPQGLLARRGSGTPALIGFAADGFPVYVSPSVQSSYQIKKGVRPSGPPGRYDGSFVQDYEYVPGAGNLDECNGRTGETSEYPQGTYHYYVTRDFPFVPRCLKGTPDPSFRKERPHTGGRAQGQRLRPVGGRPQGPPAEALDACSGKSEGSVCDFEAPHGTLVGVCHDVPEGGRACVPH